MMPLHFPPRPPFGASLRPTLRALAMGALLLSALPARAQTPTPLPPAGKAVTPAPVSVAQYRAQRAKAREALRALAARSGGGARDASAIVKSLDKPQIVRRADGATQRADGNRWSALAAGVAPTGSINENFDVKTLKREEVQNLIGDLDAEIAEVDAWNTAVDGAYYKPVDAGKIIAELEKSGQIRTGPTWLQQQIQAVKKWFGDTLENILKWLVSLFPSFSPRVGAGAPDMSWLTFVFWAIIASLVAYLLVWAYRVFAGNIRWGGRRKKSDDAELEGEDAELLLLPPDELGERAAQFARDGNFREALRHRYIALLLRLDGRGVWRYDARRTNWEHIAALRRGTAQLAPGGAEIVAPLSDLTRRFDRVRYGSAPCDAADWDAFERDCSDLEARASGAPNRETTSRETAGVGR